MVAWDVLRRFVIQAPSALAVDSVEAFVDCSLYYSRLGGSCPGRSAAQRAWKRMEPQRWKWKGTTLCMTCESVRLQSRCFVEISSLSGALRCEYRA